MFDLNDFFADAPDLAAALGDGIPRLFSTGNWVAPNVYFALGGSKSGTQFHKHEEGWYMQIFGRKKWMLYAPSDMPPIHYPPFSISVQEWLETLYPQLGVKRQPHQCTLGAGDLIYVPETWCKCCFCSDGLLLLRWYKRLTAAFPVTFADSPRLPLQTTRLSIWARAWASRRSCCRPLPSYRDFGRRQIWCTGRGDPRRERKCTSGS